MTEQPPQFEIPPLVLPKPRWYSQSERDVEAMKAWVKERLRVRYWERKNQMIVEVGDQWKLDPETGLATITYYKPEDLIAIANEDDVGPLREAYPELAPFIHPRKLARGEHRYQTPNFGLKDAVEDVFFIRQLWKREYGQWKRLRDNPPYAYEIAAEFHNQDPGEVDSRAGKNFRRKPPI